MPMERGPHKSVAGNSWFEKAGFMMWFTAINSRTIFYVWFSDIFIGSHPKKIWTPQGHSMVSRTSRRLLPWPPASPPQRWWSCYSPPEPKITAWFWWNQQKQRWATNMVVTSDNKIIMSSHHWSKVCHFFSCNSSPGAEKALPHKLPAAESSIWGWPPPPFALWPS